MDFVYERQWLPGGVKLETVTGGSRYKGRVRTEIAKQIYCENGKDGYRETGHFASGAPFLYDSDERISVSHTEGCLAVATIKTPEESNLADFTPETALGIDVERADRDKAMKLRERFLTTEEQSIVEATDVEANIIAWTCKEAMLKAVMNPQADWHHNIIITSLPGIGSPGNGYVEEGGNRYDFTLRTLLYEDEFVITVATASGYDHDNRDTGD